MMARQRVLVVAVIIGMVYGFPPRHPETSRMYELNDALLVCADWSDR
jgi:hypothetical protein